MKKQQTTTASNDYELSAVPHDKRKSFASITIVWTGFVFVITSMMAGGGLAEGLSFREIIIATLIGNVFLSLIAILISIIASKTGLTFALITRYSFGIKGSKWASLFVPIVNIGWYTIQSATYGHFIASIFGFGAVGEGICMAVSAVVMGVFALVGINAIAILGYVAIPAIVFLSLATAIKSSGMAGGISAIFAYLPESPFSMSTGITIVIGTWILSTATCVADIMRYAKSTKQAILSSLVGLVGGNTLLVLCGAIAAIASNESDLTAVLLSLGLVVPSIILMTTNIFTTNASNLYSTSLNLSNAFSMGRTKLIAIIMAISALATLTRPYQIGMLFTFLNTLGVIVPPLAGIILSDYYIVHKGKYDELESAGKVSWNWCSWVTWAVSLAIVYLLISIDFGLPALNGIIAGVVIYPIFMIIKKKNGAKVRV